MDIAKAFDALHSKAKADYDLPPEVIDAGVEIAKQTVYSLMSIAQSLRVIVAAAMLEEPAAKPATFAPADQTPQTHVHTPVTSYYSPIDDVVKLTCACGAKGNQQRDEPTVWS